MGKELRKLEAPYCQESEGFFYPEFDTTEVLKGNFQFVDCPGGGSVRISSYRENGKAGIQYKCFKCERTMRT